MVSIIGRNFNYFLENPRKILNGKTIVVSGSTGIIVFLAVSKLAQWIAERGKSHIKAVIYQDCRGLKTYKEVNKILSEATPHVSRLWGKTYITVPSYRGRCYLEELATRVVLWDRDYFSRSIRQNEESSVGKEIVQKVYDLDNKIWREMNSLKFPKNYLYFMYFVHRCFRNYSSDLESLTEERQEPNQKFFIPNVKMDR